MADSLLTRLLLQSLVIFRIAVQHEWFFGNPERFRDLVETFAAVITERPRRDFGRRDLGISAGFSAGFLASEIWEPRRDLGQIVAAEIKGSRRDLAFVQKSRRFKSYRESRQDLA